jgi:hypothetical protein
MGPEVPRLTFFCELDAAALQALFADPVLLDDLRALGASVSLGILDFSAERASVVRRLNAAGVPVVGWQLLPQAEGYWFHLGNAPQAAARYGGFLAWTREHGLRWDGVGLDIEPDLQDLRRLFDGRAPELLRALPGRLGGARLRQAREAYAALVARIRADGYRVDSYQLPFLMDEREAGSTLVQRLTGVLDLPVDREVLMLYTSFVRPHGPGLLWSYAQRARAIAVGSTGGGVELPEGIDSTPLNWEELSRDLRLAARWTRDLSVFSLEGCVRQGFLARLRSLDWGAPAEPPEEEGRRVDTLRRAASRLLKASQHPLALPGALVGLGELIVLAGRMGLGRLRGGVARRAG